MTFATPLVRPESLGVHRLAVITVEFPDSLHNPNVFDPEKAMRILDVYYQSNSYGKMWWESSLSPSWYLLPLNLSYYGPNYSHGEEFVEDAVEKALPSIDLTAYSKVMIIYAGAGPNSLDWTYPPRSWSINGATLELAVSIVSDSHGQSVIEHEAGHLLRLPDLYYCVDSCATQVIPVWDGMGGGVGIDGNATMFSSWTKLQLGWIDEKHVRTIQSGNRETITVDPLGLPPTGTSVVKVPIDATSYYLVEVREAVGADSNLPSGTGLFVLEVGTPGPGIVKWINPDTQLPVRPGETRFAAFQVGESFSNPSFGNMKIESKSGDSYQVFFDRTSIPSFRITASPDSLTILVGTCDTSILTISSYGGFSGVVNLTVSRSSNVIDGPTVRLMPTFIGLDPNASTMATKEVCADAGAVPGNYTFSITGTGGNSVYTLLETDQVTADFGPRPISIHGNNDFTAKQGVRSGDGTSSDPYMIEGWHIEGGFHTIEILDTDAYFIIRDVSLHPNPYPSETHCDADVPESVSKGILLDNVTNGRVEYSNISGGCEGISIRFSSNIAVVGNEISMVQTTSIVVITSSGIEILNNRLHDNVEAVILTSICCGNDPYVPPQPVTANIMVSGNEIIHNRNGIGIDNLSAIEVSYNNVSDTTVSLRVQRSRDINISANDFGSNDFGVIVDASTDLAIRRNSFVSNDYGLWAGSLKESTIYHNDFVENNVQVFVGDSSNLSWDGGYPRGGNYWTDHDGIDECSGPEQDFCPDSDGIGDTPRLIELAQSEGQCSCSVSLDRYPLMRHFSAPMTASFDVARNLISSKSSGKYLTAHLELRKGFDVAGVDPSSIRLNMSITISPDAPLTIGDYDQDGILDITIKFNLAQVIDLLSASGSASLEITGIFADGSEPRSFKGSDAIRVIVPAKRFSQAPFQLTAPLFEAPLVERWMGGASRHQGLEGREHSDWCR